MEETTHTFMCLEGVPHPEVGYQFQTSNAYGGRIKTYEVLEILSVDKTKVVDTDSGVLKIEEVKCRVSVKGG